MKKHLFTTLMCVIAASLMTACAEEQVAQKAAVDIKPAPVANAAAAKGKAVATGQAPAAPKPTAAATSAPVPAAPTPSTPAADTKAPVAAAQGAAKATGTPAKTAAKLDDPLPPLAYPLGHPYEARGRRDPFINPIPKPLAGSVSGEVLPLTRPDGLPGVLVSEVRLSGIVHSSDKAMNKAMLVVGRNTYFARKGDSLFDGVVKEIRPNEVVFAMVSATTKKPINRDTVVRTGASSGTSAGEKK